MECKEKAEVDKRPRQKEEQAEVDKQFRREEGEPTR